MHRIVAHVCTYIDALMSHVHMIMCVYHRFFVYMQAHPYFHSMSWNDLFALKIEAPFKPPIVSTTISECDMSIM